MGDRYRLWLDDPDIKQILEAHNAHELSEGQQAILEGLADSTRSLSTKSRRAISGSSHSRLLQELVPPMRNARDAGFMVSSLKAVVDGRRWGGAGKDPHVYTRDGSHRRGSDRS